MSSKTLDAFSLPSWQEKLENVPVINESPSDEQATDDAGSSESKFPVDTRLNEKIKLVLAEKNLLYTLDIDAVVNPTNEKLSTSDFDILRHAGEDITTECRRLYHENGICQTGESRISRGGLLSAKRIIHTVGPKYTERYETAAENALHGCYKGCLGLMKENGLRTIMFPCIYSKRKGYPRKDAAHVAIRTVRRFLEHHFDDVDAIVFYFDDGDDMTTYKELLPLYFPRCLAEERSAKTLLPANIGNEHGEPVIEERKIRIAGRIGQNDTELNEDGNDTDSEFEYDESSDPKEYFGGDKVGLRLYEECLYRAKTEYLKDILALNVAYLSGNDAFGRPVLVIVSANLPVNHVDLDRVLVYMVQLIDDVMEKKAGKEGYVVVYVNSAVSPENTPEISWMKKMHRILFCTRKHRTSMKELYIVHPTVWLKGILWCLSPFVDSDFWNSVHYVERLHDLVRREGGPAESRGSNPYKLLPAESVLLPNIAYKHDAVLARSGTGVWAEVKSMFKGIT